MEKISGIFLEKFDKFKKVIEEINYNSSDNVNLVTKDINKCRFTSTTLIFSDGTSQILVPFYPHSTCKIDFTSANAIKLRDGDDNTLFIYFVSSQDIDNFVDELVVF